jgi:hypothetical protein
MTFCARPDGGDASEEHPPKIAELKRVKRAMMALAAAFARVFIVDLRFLVATRLY